MLLAPPSRQAKIIRSQKTGRGPEAITNICITQEFTVDCPVPGGSLDNDSAISYLQRHSWSWPVWLLVLSFSVIIGWLKPEIGPAIPLGLAFTQWASICIHDLYHRPGATPGAFDRRLAARGSYAAIWLGDNFHLVWMYLIDFTAIIIFAGMTARSEFAGTLIFLAIALEPWSLGLHQQMHHNNQWFGSQNQQLIWSVLTAIAFCTVAVSL